MGASRDVAHALGDRLTAVPVLFSWGVIVGFWLLVAFMGALWIVFTD